MVTHEEDFFDGELVSLPSMNGIAAETHLTGIVTDTGVVLNRDEAKVFHMIKEVVDESNMLKRVLLENNERIKKHHAHCLTWRENFLLREGELKQQVQLKEQKIEELSAHLQTYKNSLSSLQPAASNETKIVEDLPKIIEIHSEKVQRESIEALKSLQNQPFNDVREMEVFIQQLNEKNNAVVIKAFQEALQSFQTRIEQSRVQQIPLDQHIELKSKYEQVVTSNEQHKQEIEQLKTSCSALQASSKKSQTLQIQLDACISDLKAKTDNIISLRNKLEDQSVIVENLTPDVKRLEEKINHLERVNRTLREDYNETLESYSKLEEENDQLRKQVEQFQLERNQLQTMTPSVASESLVQSSAASVQDPAAILMSDDEDDDVTVSIPQSADFCVLNKDVTDEEINAMKNEIAELLAEKIRFENLYTAIVEELKVSDDNLKQLAAKHNNEVARFNQLFADRSKMIQNMKESLKQQNRAVEEKENIIQRLEANIREKDDYALELNENLGNQCARNEELEEKVNSIAVYESQLEVYQNDFQAERQSREKLHEELTRCKESIGVVTSERDVARKELHQLQQQLLDRRQQRPNDQRNPTSPSHREAARQPAAGTQMDLRNYTSLHGAAGSRNEKPYAGGQGGGRSGEAGGRSPYAGVAGTRHAEAPYAGVAGTRHAEAPYAGVAGTRHAEAPYTGAAAGTRHTEAPYSGAAGTRHTESLYGGAVAGTRHADAYYGGAGRGGNTRHQEARHQQQTVHLPPQQQPQQQHHNFNDVYYPPPRDNEPITECFKCNKRFQDPNILQHHLNKVCLKD